MDLPTHAALTEDELNQATLIHAVVFGADDVRIGKVLHLHGSGATLQVVVDVGGFLGIGAKRIAIPIGALSFQRADDSAVYAKTAWTKDQVKALPEHLD